MQSGVQVTDNAGQQSTAGWRYCIGIVGAGKLGCYLGAHLCQDSALEVKFFGRETTALELAAHGLSVTSCTHHTYFAQPIAFYSSLNSLIECDLVLLTVKATALVPMLAQLKHFLRPDVPLVALQDGVGVGEMLSHDLSNPVIRALATFSVLKIRPGQFHRATAGALFWQRNDFAVVNYVSSTFSRLQLAVQLCDDMASAEFGKLLLDLNQALNAISGLPLPQQLADRDYRAVLALAMREWLAVCHRAGVKPQSYSRVNNSLLPWILRLPTLIFCRLCQQMLPTDASAHSPMWHDLKANKRTEIMFLNDVVVRMGQQYQVPTPVNGLLVEQIKWLESGQATSMTGADILRRLAH